MPMQPFPDQLTSEVLSQLQQAISVLREGRESGGTVLREFFCYDGRHKFYKTKKVSAQNHIMVCRPGPSCNLSEALTHFFIDEQYTVPSWIHTYCTFLDKPTPLSGLAIMDFSLWAWNLQLSSAEVTHGHQDGRRTPPRRSRRFKPDDSRPETEEKVLCLMHSVVTYAAQAIDSVSKATAPLSVFGRVSCALEAIVLLAEGIQGAWKLRPGERECSGILSCLYFLMLGSIFRASSRRWVLAWCAFSRKLYTASRSSSKFLQSSTMRQLKVCSAHYEPQALESVFILRSSTNYSRHGDGRQPFSSGHPQPHASRHS
jgi:hypothetical protein